MSIRHPVIEHFRQIIDTKLDLEPDVQLTDIETRFVNTYQPGPDSSVEDITGLEYFSNILVAFSALSHHNRTTLADVKKWLTEKPTRYIPGMTAERKKLLRKIILH